MSYWFKKDNLHREVPTPDPDGVITVFATSKPFKSGSLAVLVNGIVYAPKNPNTGYLEFGNQNFVMNSPPDMDDTLEVIYEVV